MEGEGGRRRRVRGEERGERDGKKEGNNRETTK